MVTSLLELYGSVIDAHTRKEAIEDGEQVCLSDKCPEGCEMYRYPVYATRAVWALIEEAIADEELGQDLVGVVHDLMWMSRQQLKNSSCSSFRFQCIVNGAERSPDSVMDGGNHLYTFVLSCGSFDIDDSHPVLTLMFPEEQ
ncbi:MAG: DUF6573 family protein [Cyanobacteria bacterium P01_F01_bin.150]